MNYPIGIYALALNGARAWINQDDEQSEPYGQCNLQCGYGQEEAYQKALLLFKEGKRDEAVTALEPMFEAVTRKF